MGCKSSLTDVEVPRDEGAVAGGAQQRAVDERVGEVVLRGKEVPETEQAQEDDLHRRRRPRTSQ